MCTCMTHLSTQNEVLYCSWLGMAMGRGGDEFYLPRPHTQFFSIYLLPYPYSTGMIVPGGFGYPRPIPVPVFNKK